MPKDSLKSRIRQSIQDSADCVFLRSDFDTLGGYDQVGRALSEIIKEGGLIKIGYGIYAKTKPSITGKPLPVTTLLQLGQGVLKKLGIENLDVGRAMREYRDGETTQIPMRLVLDVGKSRIARKISFGSREVYYERAKDRPPVSVRDQIKKRIQESKDIVFLRNEFDKVGRDNQVGQVLRDLVKDGALVKVGYGLYAKAQPSTISGKPVPTATLMEIGLAVMLKMGIDADLGRAAREYRDGETTQMPMADVLDVGRSRITRKISFGPNEIKYERSNIR